MAYFTGTDGAINSIPCLRRYRVMDTATTSIGVCSASGGGQIALPGNSDWRAVAVAYGAEPPSTALPGKTFTFTCSDGQVGYTASAYVEKLRVFWDVEGADLLYYELYFSGKEALSSNTSAADAASPSPVSAAGLGCSLGSSIDIRRAMLEISCLGVPFVDSGSTNGVTERLQGNFAASFEVEGYTKAVLPATNALISTTFDAGEATTWDLNYMIITERTSEMAVGDQNGRAVGNTCKLKGVWSSRDESDTEGKITTPTGTYIFGEASP